MAVKKSKIAKTSSKSSSSRSKEKQVYQTKKPATKTPSKPVSLGDTIAWPYRNFLRNYNFFWAIIPIFGWAALYGYMRKIINTILDGDRSGLPKFRFGEDMRNGWLIFGYTIVITIIVEIIAFILFKIPLIGWLLYLAFVIFLILTTPMLTIRICQKGVFEEGFKFGWAWRLTTSHIGEYTTVLLKIIVASIVWLLSIIIFLVGLGAASFGVYYPLTDYYARYAKD